MTRMERLCLSASMRVSFSCVGSIPVPFKIIKLISNGRESLGLLPGEKYIGNKLASTYLNAVWKTWYIVTC